jgi:hypothetical protein
MQICQHQMFGGMLHQQKFQLNHGLQQSEVIMKPDFQLKDGMPNA